MKMLRMMVYIHPLKLVSGVYLSSLSNALREVSCNKSFASSRYFLDSDGGKLSFKQGKNCQMIDFRCILIVFGCFWDAGFSIFASV